MKTYRVDVHCTFSIFPALLDQFVDVRRRPCPGLRVNDKLVKRRYLLATMWADKVPLQEVSLDTFFAECGPATWGFDCVLEELVINGTR
jgi:hypothetical protein